VPEITPGNLPADGNSGCQAIASTMHPLSASPSLRIPLGCHAHMRLITSSVSTRARLIPPVTNHAQGALKDRPNSQFNTLRCRCSAYLIPKVEEPWASFPAFESVPKSRFLSWIGVLGETHQSTLTLHVPLISRRNDPLVPAGSQLPPPL